MQLAVLCDATRYKITKINYNRGKKIEGRAEKIKATMCERHVKIT